MRRMSSYGGEDFPFSFEEAAVFSCWCCFVLAKKEKKSQVLTHEKLGKIENGNHSWSTIFVFMEKKKIVM